MGSWPGRWPTRHGCFYIEPEQERTGGTRLNKRTPPAILAAPLVRILECILGAVGHGCRAGHHGRRDQQHERRADLHRGQEGLFPRGRPRRQSGQFPLGGRHGSAARRRPDRSRRGLRLGRALQRGGSRHPDQDRGGQGVVPAWLRWHQDFGPQGSCRQRTLQIADRSQRHEVRHERARGQQYIDAQYPVEVRRAEIFRWSNRGRASRGSSSRRPRPPLRRPSVAGQERIDEHRRVAVAQRAGRVAEKRSSMSTPLRRDVGLQRAREPKPTATPTACRRASPRRRPHRSPARAARGPPAGRRAHRLFVRVAEPAAAADPQPRCSPSASGNSAPPRCG